MDKNDPSWRTPPTIIYGFLNEYFDIGLEFENVT